MQSDQMPNDRLRPRVPAAQQLGEKQFIVCACMRHGRGHVILVNGDKRLPTACPRDGCGDGDHRALGQIVLSKNGIIMRNTCVADRHPVPGWTLRMYADSVVTSDWAPIKNTPPAIRAFFEQESHA